MSDAGHIGPLCDEPEPDDGANVVQPDAPSNHLVVPGRLKPGETLEQLEQAYRYSKHLPKVIFEEPADDEE
jgi:hypothetical protein